MEHCIFPVFSKEANRCLQSSETYSYLRPSFLEKALQNHLNQLQTSISSFLQDLERQMAISRTNFY